MTNRDAGIALRRFGLGARPAETKAIANDPRGYVVSQLAMSGRAAIATALPAGHEILARVQVARLDLRNLRETEKPQAAIGSSGKFGQAPGSGTASSTSSNSPVGPPVAPPSVGPASNAMPTATQAPPANNVEPRPARLLREAFLADLDARIDHAVTTEAPFVERLVLFWSSHFAVSAAKGAVRGLAGAFEREVIRPHVLGRFADMLKAAAQHPAMLIYLDNAGSIGPNSQVGRNRARGLNENLGREILELHTLGVDGGYTQDDVTNLSRLLTGWSVGQIELPHTVPGKFFFAAPRHEPGVWTVLGKPYGRGGIADGEAALADLARHPSTARHVARKMARHFVSDAPPSALVAKLEKSFGSTGGDLKVLAQVLAASPEAWDAPPAKIVPPYDFLISLVRGLMPRPAAREIARLAAALGQPTWAPPSPKGWPDDDNAWTGPAAIRERLRIAEQVARRVGDPLADPRTLADDLLRGLVRPETRQAIQRAETREQGFELLVMSPEFQRR